MAGDYNIHAIVSKIDKKNLFFFNDISCMF